jgi:hypothetical protein
MHEAQFCWRVTAIDRFGEIRSLDEGQCPVQPAHYGVTVVGPIEAQLPDAPCLATVALWLQDETGAVRARNYVNVDVFDRSAATDVERTEGGYVLRFQPSDFVDSSWPNPRLGARGAKFGATGAGWVEYAVRLPEDIPRERLRGLRLRFEAGARTARSRIGWKDPVHVRSTDYPQTEERTLPTDVVVSINGAQIGATRLPDDPADAHGVLSAHLSEHWELSSHGYLITFEADAETAWRILDVADDRQLVVRFEVPRTGRRGGLNLYGARMGAYPIDPTLFVDLT